MNYSHKITKMDIVEIITKIEEARREAEVPQCKAAKFMGVSFRNYSRIKGTKVITLENLERIVCAIGGRVTVELPDHDRMVEVFEELKEPDNPAQPKKPARGKVVNGFTGWAQPFENVGI